MKLGPIASHLAQRFFQCVAWALATVIFFLSVAPPSARPVTNAGHNVEHLLIFIATGVAFGLGYPRRFWFLAVAMVAFAATVELAQILAPGRHARLSDFIVDAAASCLGVGVSYLLVKMTAAATKV